MNERLCLISFFIVLILVTSGKADDGEDVVQSESGKFFKDLFNLLLPKSRSDNMEETGRLINGGIFNTSLALQSLFSFTLPDRVGEGKDYQLQWALAIIGAVLVGGATIIPYIWNAPSIGKRKRSAEEEQTEQHVSFLARFSENMVKMRQIMDSSSEECLARFVCECSEEPKKYGIFGTIIKYMFPVQSVLARTASKSERMIQLRAPTSKTNAPTCMTSCPGLITPKLINRLGLLLFIVNIAYLLSYTSH